MFRNCKISIGKLFSHILILIAIASCKQDANRAKPMGQVSKGKEKMGTMDLRSTPARWTPGDSLWIHVKSIYEQEKVISYSPVVSTSLAILDLVEGKNDSEITVCLSTDSILSYTTDTSYVELEGYFDVPDLNIGIVVTERYNILKNSLGQYYFEKDIAYYKLDTGELVVPVFD